VTGRAVMRMRTSLASVTLLHVALALAVPAGADSISVSTAAELQAALRAASIRPGDTIYLRQGTYQGSFTSKLAGTAERPITIRSRPGEWAVIDLATLEPRRSFYIAGAHTVVRDLEVTNSAAGRVRRSGSFNAKAGERPTGSHNVDVQAPYVTLINCVVHDATHCGIALQEKAIGGEVYGCLIYDNGISKAEHGIYAGGVSDEPKKIRENIIFANASLGLTLHAGDLQDGFVVKGNVLLDNGTLYKHARFAIKPLKGGPAV
jgi:hypothetical protein